MKFLRKAAGPLLSGLLVCLGLLALSAGTVALVVRLLGGNAGAALQALHLGSIGTPNSVTNSLIAATPLILTGLSVAVAFRCGIWNIGAEGQLLVGMLGAAFTALHLPPLPPVVAVPLCLLAAAVCGALWAALPAFLKLKRNVPEVISTIMLNFLAVYLLEYLVRGPLKDPSSIDEVGVALPEWARLARLSRAFGLRHLGGDVLRLPNGQPLVAAGLDLAFLHLGVFLAVVTALGMWLWTARSGAGFRIRITGANPTAASAAGVPVARTLALAFLLSGALAGLCGGVEQLATVSRLHRYAAGEPGYGFSGIAVALLGGLQPLGVLAAALFFGALRAGSEQMQRSAAVSVHVASVVQAALVLLLVSVSLSRHGLSKFLHAIWRHRREE